mgnify:CR=1 FL=1
MSVRGYILREKHIWINEETGHIQYNNDGENLKRYTHQDLECAFNIWRQDNLVDEMFRYGAEDYTNNDFVEEIEMGKEEFESMCKNSSMNFTEDDMESIEIIKKYFEEGWNWVTFKCY